MASVFGNFLLKQVLSELGAELPQLRRSSPFPRCRFATGLRQLLDRRGAGPVSHVERVARRTPLTDLQPELIERTDRR